MVLHRLWLERDWERESGQVPKLSVHEWFEPSNRVRLMVALNRQAGDEFCLTVQWLLVAVVLSVDKSELASELAAADDSCL